ncbi:MAG: hypothetical protein R6X19_05415 [Kiritimatiellia bacterium]
MNEETPVTGVPQIEVQAAPNRFIVRDGADASSALRGGLEITAICVVSLAVILTLYYASLKLLVALFPPKAETAPSANDD